MIAKTPQPPYYAVIFSSKLTDDIEGYNETADKMEQLAKKQPGYLGFESGRSSIGISVSYWKDLDAIKAWKHQMEHAQAREKGRNQWYESFFVRICKVEKEYGFER